MRKVTASNLAAYGPPASQESYEYSYENRPIFVKDEVLSQSPNFGQPWSLLIG